MEGFRWFSYGAKLVLAAALAAASAVCGHAAAQEPSSKLTILFAESFGFSGRSEFTEAVEELISTDSSRLRLEKIEHELIYCSGSECLLDPPSGAAKADLPPKGAPRIDRGTTTVIDANDGFIFHSPGTSYPVIDRLLNLTRHVRNNGFTPSAAVKDARLLEIEHRGKRFSAVAVGAKPPSDSWIMSFVVRYHLVADGEPTVVTIVGRTFGGAARLAPALRARLRTLRTPVLPIMAGGLGFRLGVSLPPELVIGMWDTLGFKLMAFEDLAFVWKLRKELKGRGRKLIATNVEWTGPPDASPFVPYAIEDLAGIKVGIISVLPQAPYPELIAAKAPLKVGNPAFAASRAVKALREDHGSDLIVCVSHLKGEEEAQLLWTAWNIDVLIAGDVAETAIRRMRKVTLKNWRRERRSEPALRARRSQFSYGELTLGFEPSPVGPELVWVEERAGPVASDMPEDQKLAAIEEAVLTKFLGAKTSVLPDPRTVWPQADQSRLVYGPLEVHNIGAQLLREGAGTEAALLRIRPLNSNTPGMVREYFVRHWLDPRSEACVVELPGGALRPLLRRLESASPRGTGSAWREVSKYFRDALLAGAGVEKSGRISGLPLRDHESYSVALTTDLLDDPSFPELKRASRRRPLGPLADIVIDGLKRMSPSGPESPDSEARYLDRVRALAEGKTPEKPVWRLNLRDLSVQLANTQVEDNENFTQVRDARVRTIDQTLVQASSRLFSELYWGRFRWDAGVSTDYGRLTLKPRGSSRIVNETMDQVVFESDLRHKTLDVSAGKLRSKLGPFLALSYSTEFTKPEDTPTRKFLSVKPGLALSEGRFLEKVYAAALVETDYSTPAPNTEYGFEAGLRWGSPLPPTAARLRLDAAYRRFAPSRLDTADDLKSELEARARLDVPILGDLSLSPFLELYVFQGKIVRRTGTSTRFGLSLSYSFLWKPVF